MFELLHPVLPGTRDIRRLAFAGLLSLLFHAAILGGGSLFHLRSAPGPRPPEPLQATLTPLPPPVRLIAPEPAPAVPAEPAKPPPRPKPAPRAARPGFTAVDAVRMALNQIARQPFYPEEAVARGLEGEVVVRLFLDEAGNAVAARVESSSGYPILDDAAVRAAREVRSLPAGTPTEIVLPVRFRLR